MSGRANLCMYNELEHAKNSVLFLSVAHSTAEMTADIRNEITVVRASVVSVMSSLVDSCFCEISRYDTSL